MKFARVRIGQLDVCQSNAVVVAKIYRCVVTAIRGHKHSLWLVGLCLMQKRLQLIDAAYRRA